MTLRLSCSRVVLCLTAWRGPVVVPFVCFVVYSLVFSPVARVAIKDLNINQGARPAPKLSKAACNTYSESGRLVPLFCIAPLCRLPPVTELTLLACCCPSRWRW